MFAGHEVGQFACVVGFEADVHEQGRGGEGCGMELGDGRCEGLDLLFGEGVGVEDLGWCVSKGCRSEVLAGTDLVHRHVGGSWEVVGLWESRSAVLASTMGWRRRKRAGTILKRIAVGCYVDCYWNGCSLDTASELSQERQCHSTHRLTTVSKQCASS